MATANDTTLNESLVHQGFDRQEPERPHWLLKWHMLTIFVFFAFNQGLFWLTFSTIPLEELQQHYSDTYFTKRNVTLLLNWGCIVGILTAPIQTTLSTSKKGLHKCVFLGIVSCLASSILRALPFLLVIERSFISYISISMAQILNAFAGPLCMGTVSRLSILWFSEDQRTFSTALAVASNGIGTNAGFLLGPYLGIHGLVYLEVVLAFIPFLMYIVLYSYLAIDEEVVLKHNIYEGVKMAIRNLDFLILALSAALVTGVTAAWQGVLQNILSARFASKVDGVIASANGFAGNFGAILIGKLSKKGREKRELVLASCFVFIFTLLFALAVNGDISGNPWSVGIYAVLSGVCCGAMQPLFYDLGAQLVYPLNEGASIGLIVFFMNTASLLVFFVSGEIHSGNVSYIYLGSLVFALLLILRIRSP